MATREETVYTLTAEFEKAMAAMRAAQNAIKEMGQESDKTGRKYTQAAERLEEWGPAAKNTLAAVAAAATGAAVAFASFEKETSNVQNIAGLADKDMKALAQSVMDLPPVLGDADDLMRGLYQTISAGITEPEQAMAVLTASAKAARGGMADLTQTIDASTSVLAAFDIPASEMLTVLDQMTKTVDLGKLTFEDLASSIGQGGTIIAQAGVQFEELLSALATLTLRGLSTSEAMTAIRSMMVAVLKPTKEARDMAEELGIEFSTAAIKSMGFTAWLDELVAKTGGSDQILGQLFGRVEGLQGALTLASESGGAKFNEALGQIQDSTGKVESNLANMAETLSFQTQTMVTELKKLGIEFGSLLAEDLVPLLRGLTGFIGTLRDLDDPAKRTVIQIGKVAAGVAGVALVLPKVIRAIGALQKVLGLATIGSKAFTASLGPITLAAGGVAIAMAGVAEIIERSADAQLKASKAAETSSQALSRAAEELEVDLGQLQKQLGITSRQGLVEYIKTMQGVGDENKTLTRLAKAMRGELEKQAKAQKEVNEETEKADPRLEKLQKSIKANLSEVQSMSIDLNAMYSEMAEGVEPTEDLATAMDRLREVVVDMPPEIMEVIRSSDSLEQAYEKLRLTNEALDIGSELEWRKAKDGVEGVKDEIDELAESLDSIPAIPKFAETDFGKQVQAMSDIMRSEFAWAIADGLTDGFQDFTPESFAKDWASMISELIGAQLQEVMSGEEGLGGGFRNIADAIKQNPAMFGLGGAGMVFGAATGPQAGTTGGIIQGMIGGAVTGASTGAGWVGAVVGAIIGGVLAAQSDETPETRATLGFRDGRMVATSATRGGQGISGAEHELFQQKLIGAYSELKLAYRGLLQIFEDESLFALVGDLPEFDSQGWLGMSIDELGRWLTEAILPEGFENQFQSAIRMGLGRLGVGEGAIDAVFAELETLAGGQRIAALETFIQAIVGGARLLEDLDFDAIMAEVGQTPREAFVNMMQNTLDQVDLSMVGWDQLTILEQAREAQNIQDLVTQARQAEIQYLQQIVQMGDQINRSIDMQVEGLRVGGMTRQQQGEFFTQQLDMIFDTLAAGGLDPNQIAQLTGDAQRYINQLGGVFGEDLDTLLATMFGTPGAGQQAFLDVFGGAFETGATGREFLINLLEHLRGLSGGAMDEVIDEAEDMSDLLAEQIQDMMDRLSEFSGAVGDSGPPIRDFGNEIGVFNMRIIDATGALGGFIDALAGLEFLTEPTPPSGRDDTMKSGGQTIINIDPSLAPFIRLTRSIVHQELNAGAYTGTQ